jgi:hypothetical protein
LFGRAVDVTIARPFFTEDGTMPPRAWFPSAPTPHPRPRLEQLEDRTLLSAGLTKAPLGGVALPRVNNDLANLLARYQQPAPGATVPAASPLVRIVNGAVVVDAVAAGNPTTLRNDLTKLGIPITGQAGRIISCLVPIARLGDLPRLTALRFARPSYAAAPAALKRPATAATQGNLAVRSDQVVGQLGFNGSGVTVGVLSDSFNDLRGAAADVTAGALPGAGNPDGFTTPVKVVQDLKTGGTDEGRAMLQIVHGVAPGANLAFATAYTGQAGFANNITRLRNAGANVIADDVTYLDEPMFQDGVIAQAVDASVAAGVPYFSAAGNEGRQSYESTWRAGPSYDPGSIQSASGALPFLGGTALDFDPGSGVDPLQQFTLGAGQSITLSMQWDSPFFSVSGGDGSPNDLDVYVLNADGSKVLAGSNDANTGGDPVEAFTFTNTTGAAAKFNLMITKYGDGPDPGLVKYVNFDDPMQGLQFATNSGTVFGHANAAGALAVGAADYRNTPRFGVNPPTLEPYSSQGSTAILFDGAGNRITPVVRSHPDVVAPDGVDTTFFGSDTDADGLPNFYGTSAAAPNAAGVAALMLQARPGSTPLSVYSALKSTALDMGTPGYDSASGAGLIQAPNAVQALAAPVNVTLASTAPALTNQAIPVAVTFSEPVTGFTATDLTVTNASVANFAGSGATYTFTLTPTGQGAVAVSVPSGVVQGAASGTLNRASATLQRTYDSIAPTATITPAPNQPDPGSGSPVRFIVKFSEPVTGFTDTEVNYQSTAGTGSGLGRLVSETGPLDGTTYLVELSGMYQAGTVRAWLPAGVATDAAGNPSQATTADAVVQFQPTPGTGYGIDVVRINGKRYLRPFYPGQHYFAQILPFGPSYFGPVRIATADVTGDGVPDMIVTKETLGPGAVRVFEGVAGKWVSDQTTPVTGQPKVTTAVQDVNGDGVLDAVVSTLLNGKTTKWAWNGLDMTPLSVPFV